MRRTTTSVGALLALLLLAAPVARADDAPVSAEGVIPADPAAVRALIADYSQIAAMTPDVLDYRVEAAPPCTLVHVTTRGLTAPMKYTVKRCPTATGLKETLVQTDGGMEAITTEWTVAPADEGSRVRVTVLARVARVPQFLVNQQTRQSLGNLVKQVAQKLTPRMR